jgi:hypothetical protein
MASAAASRSVWGSSSDAGKAGSLTWRHHS